MTQKRTPWTVTENKTIDGDIMICVVAANGVTVIWQAYDNVENRKTAALIAAAPDLLEALKYAHTSLRTFSGSENFMTSDYETLDIIEAAIAKAEGKI